MKTIEQLRQEYHQQICKRIIRISDEGKPAARPNFADKGNASSIAIAWGIVKSIGCLHEVEVLAGQRTGGRFENITRDFLKAAFEELQHLRPGKWLYSVRKSISAFDQYEHLGYLEQLFAQNTELASAMGSDYIIKPDIVIGRHPVSDTEINQYGTIVDDSQNASLTALRESNREPSYPILHASISCKWTIRSDRAQNARTEALNLIRNRKGQTPHIVAVTAEPLPTRLAALALGTGDLDCVYHFALHELIGAIERVNNIDQLDMLKTLVDGRRLRDISDLPFDLAV